VFLVFPPPCGIISSSPFPSFKPWEVPMSFNFDKWGRQVKGTPASVDVAIPKCTHRHESNQIMSLHVSACKGGCG
jgi:hypothetical protein